MRPHNHRGDCGCGAGQRDVRRAARRLLRPRPVGRAPVAGRGRRHGRPGPADLRPCPGRPRAAGPDWGRLLHWRRVLVHLLDRLRQPGCDFGRAFTDTFAGIAPATPTHSPRTSPPPPVINLKIIPPGQSTRQCCGHAIYPEAAGYGTVTSHCLRQSWGIGVVGAIQYAFTRRQRRSCDSQAPRMQTMTEQTTSEGA